MLRGFVAAFVMLAVLVAFTGSRARGGESPLDDADRRAFTWFDGLSIPSCAGKKYVRVTWVRKSPRPDAPPAERLWETDGFLLAENAKHRTILDADQIARKVTLTDPDWTTSITPLDLAATAEAAAARLRAMKDDPGAIEPIEAIFHGVRRLLGDEAQSLALAKHCAENKLDAQAHALLEAARSVAPTTPGKPVAPLEAAAAAQLVVPLMRRMVVDIGDVEMPRARLVERLRAWRKCFADSPHVARADEAIRILEPMAKEDAQHRAVADAALAKLAPAAQAKELVFRLRDQTGDIVDLRRGAAYLDLDRGDSPVERLAALKFDAVPALIDALTDARFSRAVLFRLDETLDRQFVARIGDVAHVALERITQQKFRDVTLTLPSMFQDGSAAATHAKWVAWWKETSAFPAALATIAAEPDAARRAALARALPDRGTGRLGGASDATWGTKSFTAAVPNLAPEAAKSLLCVVIAESPHPRTKALSAWALLDFGDESSVGSMITAWRAMDDAARGNPEQGGAVISFLAACGRAEAVAALADGLDARSPSVRELVVLALADRGFGAVRGFAADRPDGISERWSLTDAVADAVEDIVAARLTDLDEDPLGRIPRQFPICDSIPSFDCGRRIADAATRVLARRWPTRYVLRDEPVRSDTEWESLRVGFIDAWAAAKAARKPR
ncbi:MAG: hypothetical protein K8T90_19020 [Planctomycetes bacterium]|nr:hypothetical protein [Planctomycetota bacterium]